MNDKLHEQVSALVDDELEEREQALLLRQLASDTELSGRLSRFQIISDALQNHLLQHEYNCHVWVHSPLPAVLPGPPAERTAMTARPPWPPRRQVPDRPPA